MLQQYVEMLEGLSLREKCLVAATVAAFLVSILQFAVIDPRIANKEVYVSQLNRLQTETTRLQQQLDSSSLTPSKNRQAVILREIKALEAQLQQDHEQIKTHASGLVPAAQVPSLLNSLIADQNVELVSLQNLAPISLLDDNETSGSKSLTTDAKAQTSKNVALYQHGFELELSGSYHALRQYLVSAEQQPWKLIWHAIEFEVQPDGSNLMTLHLRTLSTDNAWLGI